MKGVLVTSSLTSTQSSILAPLGFNPFVFNAMYLYMESLEMEREAKPPQHITVIVNETFS